MATLVAHDDDLGLSSMLSLFAAGETQKSFGPKQQQQQLHVCLPSKVWGSKLAPERQAAERSKPNCSGKMFLFRRWLRPKQWRHCFAIEIRILELGILAKKAVGIF